MICETISRQPREVRAADAEQDAGDRQHRDRQHHALADFLQEEKAFWKLRTWYWKLVFDFGKRARAPPRRCAQ